MTTRLLLKSPIDWQPARCNGWTWPDQQAVVGFDAKYLLRTASWSVKSDRRSTDWANATPDTGTDKLSRVDKSP